MKHRIMVVDDEPQVRELLSLYLMQKGYEVTNAGSSAESLESLERNPVDVVVLDIGLSGEDGLALLPLLKAEHPNLKVVMLTGMGFVEDLLEEAQRKGADGYVSKALPLDELLQAIARVLEPGEGRAGWRAA
jgi:CheY-like chemotaxis protein